MSRKYIFYYFPAILVFVLFLFLPAAQTLINILKNLSIQEVINYGQLHSAIKNTFLICVNSFLLQFASSIWLSNIMLKSKDNLLFTQLFLILSFIPLGVVTYTWLLLMKHDTLVIAHINHYFNFNLLDLFINNYWLNILLTSFCSALPWIGFHAILIFYLIKSIPQNLYDNAKMDGLEGLSLLKHLILPEGWKIIFIYIFIISLTSVKIFEASYVLDSFGSKFDNIFTIWNKSLKENNYITMDSAALLIPIIILIFVLSLLLISKTLLTAGKSTKCSKIMNLDTSE